MKESKLPFINPSLTITGELLIVGSSNSLLNNYGGLIDSFQTVFRFNRAPLIGYEKHVGSKTNFRILNNHVFENINPGKEFSNQQKSFIRKIENTNILRIGPGKVNRKAIEYFERKKNEVYLFDYEYAEELKQKVNFNSTKNMSVGAIMISLSLISGIKTNIIGFDLDEREVTHYWEQRPKKMSLSHDFSFEKTWINNLVKENKINSLN